MRISSPFPSQKEELRALWQEAFGDDNAFLDLFEQAAFSPDRCRCLTQNGKIASALYWFECTCRGEKIAYLYAIATAKTYRGRGLCRALMENTHEHLLSLGYAGAILVPSEKSLFSFYQKLGYEVCSGIGELCCEAAAKGSELRQIAPLEYAALRRTLLPSGGVIQEGENLAFLAKQASFYTGDDFLLAARCESETLFGIELLGNKEKAPAIVKALGCSKGQFRIVSSETDFAMYFPFLPEILPPTYFGFAFD